MNPKLAEFAKASPRPAPPPDPVPALRRRLNQNLAEDANSKDFADWLNRRGFKKREPDALDASLFALLKAARVLVHKSEQPSTPPTTP